MVTVDAGWLEPRAGNSASVLQYGLTLSTAVHYSHKHCGSNNRNTTVPAWLVKIPGGRNRGRVNPRRYCSMEYVCYSGYLVLRWRAVSQRSSTAVSTGRPNCNMHCSGTAVEHYSVSYCGCTFCGTVYAGKHASQRQGADLSGRAGKCADMGAMWLLDRGHCDRVRYDHRCLRIKIMFPIPLYGRLPGV